MHLLPTGATIQRLILPDRNGVLADVALGFDEEEAYRVSRAEGGSRRFSRNVQAAAQPTGGGTRSQGRGQRQKGTLLGKTVP